MGIGTAPAQGAETTLLGQNNPAVDYKAVQNAVDHYDIVNLQGTFNFANRTSTKGPIMVTRDVIIRGEEPVGRFSPDQDNWVDERDWSTEIVVVNGNPGTIIRIDNPGGIVELVNLSITTVFGGVIDVGDLGARAARDACKDLHIRNCNIIITTPGGGASCIATSGGLMGTCYLEGCYLMGPYCIGEWALWQGFMGNSKWEIHANTLISIAKGCIQTYGSKDFRMENNQCEGTSISFCNSTQGEIVIKNNTMIQSGHFVARGQSYAWGLDVSHQSGFRGGEISGNLIQMNPSKNVSLLAFAMGFATDSPGTSYDVPAGAQGLLIQDNTTIGKADFGIVLDFGASDNIIRRNYLEGLTAVQSGAYSEYGAAQIGILSGCENNVLRDNVIGPLGFGARAGIYCEGNNNDIIRNDFTKSSILGLTAGDMPCVILGPGSKRNLVFEPDGFPSGTTAADQVLDDSCDRVGMTTNILVGP